MADDEFTPDQLANMSAMIRDAVPHNRALGLEIVRLAGGEVWLKLPYAKQLVGNPALGTLHGGAISSMMDAACGLAIFSRIGRTPGSIATLDLRIDYLRTAPAGKDIVARTNCYRVTRHVCFVRGTAYADVPGGEDDPVAAVTATFARKS